MEENIEDYIFAPCEKWNFHTAIRSSKRISGYVSHVAMKCLLKRLRRSGRSRTAT